MQDRGSHFDNPVSNRHDLAMTPAELGTPIPTVRPLSADEIFKIERSRLGLRNTNPARLKTELTEGTMADYVVIANLGSFLTLNADDPFHLGIKDRFDATLINGAIDKGRLDLLDGLDSLPGKYNQALLAYFREALRIRMNNLFDESNEHMTLSEYFDKYIVQNVPAYVLFQGDKKRPPSSYDIEKYYGFGKEGRKPISSKDMLAYCQLTQDDIKTLKDRYQRFLHLPVSTYVQAGNKRVHLADVPDFDIVQLTHGKVLGMIRDRLIK